MRPEIRYSISMAEVAVVTPLESFAINGVEKTPRRINFDNTVEYQDWVLQTTATIYPESHAASRYANQLFDRLSQNGNRYGYRIYIYHGSPNAFALPNGSIYMSETLLSKADNAEEILFLQQHEKSHVDEGHSEREVVKHDGVTGITVRDVLASLGRGRFHEWESDIRALDKLDELGINPVGAIDFLEKLRTLDRGVISVTHGKTADRVLNLRSMTYLSDLNALEKPLTPVPDEVKFAIRNRVRFQSPYEMFIHGIREMKFDSIAKAGRLASPEAALISMRDVVADYQGITALGSKSAKLWGKMEQGVIAGLAHKVWGMVNESSAAEGLSRQQKTFLYYALLEFTGGCKATDQIVQEVMFDPRRAAPDENGRPPPTWTKRNFGFQEKIYADEDVEECLQALDPELFNKTGFKINFRPYNFVKNLTERAWEQYSFHDDDDKFVPEKFVQFANKLSDTISNLYKKVGVFNVDSLDLYETVIDIADDKLPDPEAEALRKLAEQLQPSSDRPALVLRSFEKKSRKEVKELSLIERTQYVFDEFAHEYEIWNENLRLVQLNSGDVWGTRSGKEAQAEIKRLQGRFTARINRLLNDPSLNDPDALLKFYAQFRAHVNSSKNMQTAFNENNEWIDGLLHDRAKVVAEAHTGFNTDAETIGFLIRSAFLSGSSPDSSTLAKYSYELGRLLLNENLDLATYKHFYDFAKNSSQVISAQTGVAIRIEDLMDSASWTSSMREGIYYLIDNAVRNGVGKAEIGELLEILTVDYPFIHYGEQRVAYRESMDAEEDETPADSPVRSRIVREILSRYDFDLSDPKDLRTLYFVSTYLADISLIFRLQSEVWDRLSPLTPFNEGFPFLQREVDGRRLRSFRVLQSFIDQQAQTHEEIDDARKSLLQMFTRESASLDYGRLVVAEQFVDNLFKRDKLGFLLAAIGNGSDDSMLKSYLYSRWTGFHNVNAPATEDNLDLPDMVDRLYKLDPQSKYVFIRDLLAGDNGVLMHKDVQQRTKLVDFFLDNFVQTSSPGEQVWLNTIRDVLHEVVRNTQYDLLYFALSSLIQDRFLLPPGESVAWADVIKNAPPPRGYSSDYVGPAPRDRESIQGRRGPREEDDEENYRGYSSLDLASEDEDYHRARQDNNNYRPTNTAVAVIEIAIMPRQRKNADKLDRDRIEYEQRIKDMLRDFEKGPERVHLSVSEFLLETAQTLGAPGVRFLQLLGQYLELPPELEQSFRNVYDKIEGQSKITAQKTLLREWPQARTDLQGLGNRLGGGSLMTVYKVAHTPTGQERVVKVANPNSKFHTETTHKVLQEVFTSLARKRPEFAPALALLDDIKQWIDGDIDYRGFLEADSKFRRKNDGYNNRGRYKVKVPQSFDPENRYFQFEEFIPGRNLTEMDELQRQGHDMPAAVNLLVNNFFEQIKDGQIHSDLHPGNIKITPMGEIALLDRNYYLQFGMGEKLFLWRLQGSLGKPQQTAQLCLDYLSSQGVDIQPDQRQRILDQSKAIQNSADPGDRLMKLSVSLRKEGLKFPLKVTMLIKNFLYLDKLAKRVGYSGIAEAYKGIS